MQHGEWPFQQSWWFLERTVQLCRGGRRLRGVRTDAKPPRSEQGRTSQRRAGFRHPRLLVPLQPRFTQPPAACISHTRSISCFFRPEMHELDTLSCILAAKRALSVHSKKYAMGTALHGPLRPG
jgi:hypothetical protein